MSDPTCQIGYWNLDTRTECGKPARHLDGHGTWRCNEHVWALALEYVPDDLLKYLRTVAFTDHAKHAYNPFEHVYDLDGRPVQ